MRLETIFSNVLKAPIETLCDTSSPRNTENWDSLRHIELVMAIENAFRIQFTMPEIMSLATLGDVRRLLAARGFEV